MLQYADLKTRSTALLNQFNSLWGRLDLAGSKTRLDEIEQALSKPGAWDKPEKLTPLLQEKRRLDQRVAEWEVLLKAKTDLDDWLAMAREDQGDEVLEGLDGQIDVLDDRLQETEVAMLLSGDEDKAPAILEIHPGAGGTESQDWAEMLLRMYRRWAERHDCTVEILDFLDGDEAGVKSVTLRIAGVNTYGLLKTEKGIHRLIRISPFDSSGRRHTSFASVDVYPDAGDDIEIDLREEDLRVDTFRSSGPGGQSVNTTSSAVRVTHVPTGVVAQCQNEKSQLRNKETAIQILKARLYDLELRKKAEERQAEYDGKEAIAWGSQIRTYTLQPYRLVKDHRSNTEIGDVDAVLDGKLDTLIRETLLYMHAQKKH
ncbi:MAG: peptide chain release factor 2 [Desulfovibrionaceae bacterium]